MRLNENAGDLSEAGAETKHQATNPVSDAASIAAAAFQSKTNGGLFKVTIYRLESFLLCISKEPAVEFHHTFLSVCLQCGRYQDAAGATICGSWESIFSLS